MASVTAISHFVSFRAPAPRRRAILRPRCFASGLPLPAPHHHRLEVRGRPRLAPPRAAAAPAGLAALAALLPPGALAAAAVVVLGAAAAGAAMAMRGADGDKAKEGGAAEVSAEAVPKDAVLVAGATGQLGAEVVGALLAAGAQVVAAGRQASAGELEAALAARGLAPGPAPSGGYLHLAPGTDIADPGSLSADLFRGVTAVVAAVGPRFGKQADGSMGFAAGSSPAEVDSAGVAALVAAAAEHLPATGSGSKEVLSMRSAEDLETWRRLDDVIMGGQSSSVMALAEAGGEGTAVWTGNLILEGGGFCGTRTDAADFGLTGYDGICLRVKGSGQRLKLNLKTEEQADVPESTYQACFNTLDGEWTTVRLPWHEFRCVKRASFDPAGPPLDPAKVRQMGLVYSRFEFNGLPNPFFAPGEFRLLIDGGVRAYKEPRPQFVMVSSAGVERNARIGDDAEARAADIPIVQLNPGGILNYKYEGECALRASRLSYTIVRPTGLVQGAEEAAGPCLALEFGQGDTVSGRVSRAEVAQVAAAALALPAAVGKTFEVRRCEAADAKDRTLARDDLQRLFLCAHTDWDRAKFGVPPYPRPVEYVPPPAKEAAPAAEAQESEPVAASA
eukprot:jgi/Tetstr1/436100/TSEL_024948.t1